MIDEQRPPRPLIKVSIIGAIVALNIACITGFVTGPIGFVLKFFIGLGDKGYTLPLSGLLFIPILGALFGMGSGLAVGPVLAVLTYAFVFGRFSEEHWIKQQSTVISGILGGLIGGLLAALIGGFLAGLILSPMLQ